MEEWDAQTRHKRTTSERTPVFRHLKPVTFVACLLLASVSVVEAGTWHEYRLAGLRAYNHGDFTGAIEQFDAALITAYEEQAPADHVGAILEDLSVALLAAGQPQRAWVEIEQWDHILAASAGQSWAIEQKIFRDALAPRVLRALAQPESSGDKAPAAIATNPPPEPDNYAIHLESLKNQDNVQSSWAALKEAYPSQLAAKSLIIKRVDLGEQGIFYRILAAPFSSKGDADRACRELKGQGQYCAVRSLK